MARWNRRQRLAICIAAALAGALLGVALLSCGAPQHALGTRAPLTLLEQASPAPEASFAFVEGPERPLMEDGYRHALGTGYPIAGEVRANYPLTGVTVTISCAYHSDPFYPYRYTVYFPEGSEVYTYRLDSTDTLEGTSITGQLDLAELRTGVHTLKVIASSEGAKSVELLRVRFYVMGDAWEQLVPEDFNDSYNEALAFFGGDTDRFCYRYQWVDRRYILADPDWEETYITTIEGLPEGETWRVHVDAVPYFERALAYLRGTYVRVSGTNGDSGPVLLADLVGTYDGCYVSRFTSSLQTISHHGFGTAVDLNAALSPNLNEAENKAVIDGEVRDHLAYNGIVTVDGVPCYDYTYDGAYDALLCGVPETVVNYLLYELAFYRAGFLWAHYYRSTSDAMHFTLSEFVYGSHDGAGGLRKVFDYLETPAP